MTDITELAQILKASAKRATPGQWVAFTDAPSRTFSVHTPDDKRCGDVIKWAGFDGQRKAKANAEFIALANPANILALVEALEKAQAELVNDSTIGKPLTIILPDISSKAFWSGAGRTETFHPGTYRRWVREAIERYCAIARIDVEVK